MPYISRCIARSDMRRRHLIKLNRLPTAIGFAWSPVVMLQESSELIVLSGYIERIR